LPDLVCQPGEENSRQKIGVEAFYELRPGSPLFVVGDEPFQSPSLK